MNLILVVIFCAVSLTQARFLQDRYRRALPPAYLGVQGHQQCLATFKASPTHTEKCLPLKPLVDCPVQTWSDLHAVLSEGKPIKKKITSRAVQPSYLTIEGHQLCLGEFQASETHTEKCLPLQKPLDCEQNVWEQVNDEFKGSSCPQQQLIGGLAGLPPAYLTVNGYQDCLLSEQTAGGHQGFCYPDIKPEDCEEESYVELKNVFQGPTCQPEARKSRQIRALPPQYLSVPNFKNCLGSYTKVGDSHSQRCMPKAKPAECPEASWAQLGKVFVGDQCPEEARKSRQIGVGAPAYLQVPNFQDCLGEHKKPGDTHTERCLPAEKPSVCPEPSWEKLNEVFKGDKCLEQVPELRQIGHGAPTYLQVPNFQDCLGEHQKPGDTHTERCLPAEKPSVCPQPSWEKLNEVFEGDKCPELHQIGLGAPAYLQVPNFQDCLDEHQKPLATHSEKCLPAVKPNACPEASWNKLVQVFTGETCLNQAPQLRQVGGGPPAYLQVPNFQDCLGEQQKPSETHTERCLPAAKPSVCLQASWDTLVQVFSGDKCLEQAPASRQVGVGAPAYLQVPNFSDCLGDHQKPNHTFSTKCMPEVKPENCPDASWTKLVEVFEGEKCIKQDRKSRALTSAVFPPMYLSVEGHAACLSVHQPTSFHAEKCLPVEKPAACLESAWNDLQDVFEGIRCPKEGKSSVPWSSIEGHEHCLELHQTTASHMEKCLPLDQPAECDDEAWAKIEVAFDGIQCPPLHVGGVGGLPPAYLFVQKFESCLEIYQPTLTHSEYCLPQVQPEQCDESAWTEIMELFAGIRCPALKLGHVSANPPSIGGQRPAYLGVVGHQNCLGDQEASSGSHSEKCLPAEKPASCSDEAWDQLSEVFTGNPCSASQGPKIVGGASSLPPAYLKVEGSEACLETHQPTPNFSEKCLPQFQPLECAGKAWRKLTQVFDGIRCSIKQVSPTTSTDGSQPDYLSVEGQQACLGYHQIDDAHTVKCLPSEKPAGCEKPAWTQLQNVFSGIGCPKEVVTAGKPAYLDVEGHEFCLGTYRASDTHTEKCLPRDKLEDCDDSAWEQLPAVFTGIRCPAAKKKETTSQVVDLSNYKPQLPLGFQDCLMEQLASESHMEKCLPLEKPDFCSETTWDDVSSEFVGAKCRRQPNALPPHYLSVEGHENCLVEVQAFETHSEVCLPGEIPEECPLDAWESLQINFEGNGCREGRASPFEDIPSQFKAIPGYKQCIRQFQATESDEAACLPLAAPEGCTVEAFDALQELAFAEQLPRDGRQGPVGVGARPPAYLGIQGYQNCLGSHQASETHQEVCLPAEKPTGCDQEAWTALTSGAFEGGLCRGARDDHVNFPQSQAGPGQKIEVIHRPGEVEIAMRFCNTDGDCYSADQNQICNLFFLVVTDQVGVNWEGACVPALCDSQGKCPLIGSLISGAVGGRCKKRSNKCQYDQVLQIA